ncbi:MAG: thermonuclease family protein [Candidatus Omnitrophica bacterium]|nr:thermonuclease family protein [Candidatus Omnitrophota bacterium]
MTRTQRNTTLTLLLLTAAIVGALVERTPSPSSQIPTDQALSGTVLTVADGDTMTLRVDGQKVKVRLQGIDCPERQQAYGQEAGDFIREQVQGEQVEVRKLGVDQYDRVLGEVFLNGENLNKELLREGLAWWYEKHARDRTDYRDLQDEAKREGRGLWSDPDAIPPWEFRWRERE